MSLLLLLLVLLSRAAWAEPLVPLERAGPLEADVSLAGTWARVQFNQHLRSHWFGRASTFLHVGAGGNLRAPWSGLQQPCRFPAGPIACVSLIPDAGDVLVRGPNGWSLDLAEPVRSGQIDVEVVSYLHLGSVRPWMLGHRRVSGPSLLVVGGRLQLDSHVVENAAVHSGKLGRMTQLRAGPMYGYQISWFVVAATWTPVGVPLGGRLGNDPELSVDLWDVAGFAPASFAVFADFDFPVDQKGFLDWISPEFRFRRTPIHAKLAGGRGGERAWVHELTWQVIAIAY